MNKVFAIAGGTLLVAGLGVSTPSAGSAATSTSAHPDAVAAAKDYIQENPAKVRGSSRDAYTVVDNVGAANGESHVRFNRTYGGLPVIGGDFVVHLTSAEKTNGLSVAQDRTISVSTSPKVDRATARQQARESAAKGSTRAGSATLVVDARRGTPALAWRTIVSGVQADGQTPSRQVVVTDAKTNEVRSAQETILTPVKMGTPTKAATSAAKPRPQAAATGTGQGIFIGSVSLSTSGSGSSFTMLDSTHGGNRTCNLGNHTAGTCTTFSDTDNAWGDGTVNDPASAAVDAHFGAATTFDYFKTVHGRNGIFGDGRGVPSRVHYGKNYVNAFWDGSQMTYGDGSNNQNPLVALDVAGHEMTHGVTENTAGLEYTGDAGGLNESTSDIFGTMVEFYANSTADTPDFLIGEEININGDGSPLRYMDDPSKDGGSFSCWSPSVPGSDPHYSSGVGNHFFYLLSNGSGPSTFGNSPTCNGSTVAGIGRDKAAAIWFGALSNYMTTTETYAQARLDTVKSATDLYGAGSPEVTAVKATWSAVSVS
ncbi:M4 family metallopeptidase [Aeromicrobium sp.]|uniref:M4 family metallopeptidase n=1 Tax=Aeromicrobium sp. TaxID=1871063 RepID=UPI0019C61289|nr:M4 family metallopeptidase [Aeromicrobium sp.]MBC7633840.1 M4 family metallopeptidase [Aeromicrobium sp.]